MKKIIAAIVVAALALVFYGNASAIVSLHVKAEGIATRFEDKGDVKKRAVERALAEAVIEAISTLEADGALRETTDELKKKAASSAPVYVLDYKILAEGWLTHLDMTPPSEGDNAAGQTATLSSPSLPGVEVFHIRLEANIDAAQLKKALLVDDKGAPAHIEGLTLVLLDFSGYAGHKEVMATLEKTAQIKDLTYVSLYRGKTVLSANSTVGAHALVRQLARDLQGCCAVVSGTDGIIVIRPQTISLKGD
ncbi:MAG: hypothetical protein HY886_06740 [Deltaproteobacteria bacterium]|nr:hypothetical protein [Deltaproteobacteria bacterium]